MKKIIKSLTILLLCLVMLFPFTACKVKDEPLDKEIKDTDITLFDNGKTLYSIVIPKKSRQIERFAAEELANFLNQASNAIFPIIDDEDIVFNDNHYCISIGNTTILNGSGVAIDNEKLGDSGFVIERKNKTMILSGSKNGYGYGSLYAVYDFLKYNVGYEFYADTEISITKSNKAMLKNTNYTYLPTFDERSIGEYETTYDLYYRNRLKTVSPRGDEFGIFGHTNALYILPTEVYQPLHKDWFSNADGLGRRQLCFTNGEMQEEYIKRLKEIIISKPDSKYFQLGQEDTEAHCVCEKCMSSFEKHGAWSGVQIEFVNSVLDEILPWVKTNFPEREIEFVIFAYQFTETAPVTYDKAKDKYIPNHKDSVPNENLVVMIAPINMDFSKPLTDTKNLSSMKNIKEWSAISKKLMLWKYSFYADDTVFVPFNNLSTYKEINDVLKTYNITYLFEEALLRTKVATFGELRYYVQAKMMWNGDLDTRALIEDFIRVYYKDASEEIQTYYDLLNSWQAVLNAKEDICNGDVWNKPSSSAKYWPIELLRKFDGIFEQAFEKIKRYENSDPKLYSLLYERIEKETLMATYFKLKYYSGYYSNYEYSELINRFERDVVTNDITAMGSASTAQKCSDFIKEMRKKLR